MPGLSATTLIQPVYREFLQLEISRPMAIPLHQHHDYELIRAVKGIYSCELNREPLSLRPGQAVLVKPGDLHFDNFSNVPVSYQALSFYVESRDSGKPVEVFHPEVEPEQQTLNMPGGQLRGFFAQFAAEAAQADEFSAPIRQAIMSELFWSLARSFPAEIRGEQLVSHESEATCFVEALRSVFARYKRQNDLDVDTIATCLHMSRRNLSRKCLLNLGLSPAKAFLHYRIHAAAGLLRQTNMNCKEVSLYMGFSNPYHVSVTFKRVTGINPQAYKDGEDPHGPRFTDWPE